VRSITAVVTRSVSSPGVTLTAPHHQLFAEAASFKRESAQLN
jgi:hypothetical protein